MKSKFDQREIVTLTATRQGAGPLSTRERLLATALRLIAEHGFDGTSLQMIADEVGVTKAAVYYHFRTKAEILQAILEPSVAAATAMLDSPAERSKRGRIERLVDGLVSIVLHDRYTISIVSRDPAARRHPVFEATIGHVRERALQVTFGPEPTIDERAAFYLIVNIPEVVPFLDDVPDHDLREALRTVCFRTLGVRPRRPNPGITANGAH
jgi:AcrR family transcriptional regulator